MPYFSIILLAFYLLILFFGIGTLFNSIQAILRGEGSYDKEARREKFLGTLLGCILILVAVYLIINKIDKLLGGIIRALSPR